MPQWLKPSRRKLSPITNSQFPITNHQSPITNPYLLHCPEAVLDRLISTSVVIVMTPLAVGTLMTTVRSKVVPPAPVAGIPVF